MNIRIRSSIELRVSIYRNSYATIKLNRLHIHNRVQLLTCITFYTNTCANKLVNHYFIINDRCTAPNCNVTSIRLHMRVCLRVYPRVV